MPAPLLPEDGGEDHADDKGNGENDEEKVGFFHEKLSPQRHRGHREKSLTLGLIFEFH